MSDEGADGQDVPTGPPEAPDTPPGGIENPEGEEEAAATETTELVPRPVYPPTRCYATRQTMGLGALDLSLLMANATQLTAVLGLPGTKNSNFIALLVFLGISILLLVATGGMLVYLGVVTPKSQAVFTLTNRVNTAALCLILAIVVTNVFIIAFGVSYIGENR